MDLKKMFPEIKSFPGRIELLYSGKLKASVTEIDGITVVLGDTDVKWVVVYNLPFSEIKRQLSVRGKDKDWWSMMVLAHSSPILDEMIEEDEVRKAVNGFFQKKGMSGIPEGTSFRSFYPNTVEDVGRLLKAAYILEPESEAKSIVMTCRHWDEQFVRSLDILEYVENSL